MAPTVGVIGAMKLLCFLVASVCLLPYLTARPDLSSILSHITSRALSTMAMTNNYTPSEGTQRILNLTSKVLIAESRSGNRSGTHQNLQMAPPLPILDLSLGFITAITNNTMASNNSPLNSTFEIPQEKFGALGHGPGHLERRHLTPAMLHPLVKRGGAEQCSKGKPCPDGR